MAEKPKDKVNKSGVTAAHAIKHAQRAGDFAPGEWDALLAKGENSGRAMDGLSVLLEFRKLRAARSASKP